MRFDSRARPAVDPARHPAVGGFVFAHLRPRSHNASPMKRDDTEVRSPVKPPRAVHSRLSQLDTQPDPPALDPRLSQADTVVARLLMTRDPCPFLVLQLVYLIRLFLTTRLALLPWSGSRSLTCLHPSIAVSWRCQPPALVSGKPRQFKL